MLSSFPWSAALPEIRRSNEEYNLIICTHDKHGPTVQLYLTIFVYRMEFDKTKWSCPRNSDQNCTKNIAGGGGVQGVGGGGLGDKGGGGPGGGGGPPGGGGLISELKLNKK